MAKHWRIRAWATLRLGFRVFIAALISCINGNAVGFELFAICWWLLAPIVREVIKADSGRRGSAGSSGNLQSRMRICLALNRLFEFADLISQIIEKLLDIIESEDELGMEVKMIRIYTVVALLKQLFEQLSVKLVARMAKHWQLRAWATLRLGFRVFIAALISCINGNAVGFGTFVRVYGAL